MAYKSRNLNITRNRASAANTSALTVALDNLASITAEANTGACDMEVYIALI